MYVVEDKGGAIALMLGALIFLGTWPAVLTLLDPNNKMRIKYKRCEWRNYVIYLDLPNKLEWQLQMYKVFSQ